MNSGRWRILHVITDLKLGGESRVLAASVAALPEFEHVVACLARNLDPEIVRVDLAPDLEGCGVPVIDLGIRRRVPGTSAKGAARLAALVRELRPHLVHSTLVHANLVTLSVVGRRTPLVVGLANVQPWTAAWQPSIHGLLSRRAEVVLANAPAVAAAIVASGGADAQRVRCLPYAVDVERFTPRGEAADLGDGTIVLGIGRLVEEKGFVDLIDAVATMEPKPRIALLGEGPMADDLRIHATRSGIDLLLLGGVQDVAPYLRRADAVVFSSHWEGLPAALLEALAVARPVVATTVGGIPDVIRDAQHGLLVPPAQPKALAPAIARALGEEGRALGSRGRALVSERHSWPRYVEMRRMLYESLSQAGNRDSLIRLT